MRAASPKKQHAAEHGFVVAAGGDGTINDVVNGLAGSDAALGILPVGTMNVFRRRTWAPK
jgi:diacylglycerol kinase family enzyme